MEKAVSPNENGQMEFIYACFVFLSRPEVIDLLRRWAPEPRRLLTFFGAAINLMSGEAVMKQKFCLVWSVKQRAVIYSTPPGTQHRRFSGLADQ